ncbi:hypothetical protein HmCmsJML217_02520 [Escherichia coli]|nr:hypothetical protein HmCmsJML217_02520 [Escherichia coli]
MEIKLIDNPVKLAEFLNNPANTGNIVDSGDKYYITTSSLMRYISASTKD